MRICFYCPSFYPKIGGLENVALDVATELSLAGHELTVLTDTPIQDSDNFPFLVCRQPGFWASRKCIKATQVVVHFNVSLYGLIPWLFTGIPWVATHHGEYSRDWKGALKIALANKWAKANIACSKFVGQYFKSCTIIPSNYNENKFTDSSRTLSPATQYLVFLGRLVSEKGVPVLLNALVHLRTQDLYPQLSIIGDGPERSSLEKLAYEMGLDQQVTFWGTHTGAGLASLLSGHRVMVVPSICNEGFGIVALEGIASGCVVIGSNSGGLPEAIGPCGLTFSPGDSSDLAAKIAQLYRDKALFDQLRKEAPTHLAKHTRATIAAAYLQVLQHVRTA